MNFRLVNLNRSESKPFWTYFSQDIAEVFDCSTTVVERKIAKVIPNNLTIVLIVGTVGDCHYAAVHASFSFECDDSYSKFMLGFSTLEE